MKSSWPVKFRWPGLVRNSLLQNWLVVMVTMPSWDSLRHVELVFELEEAFGIDIAQADIAGLYSDTDTVLAYLRERVNP